MLELNKANVNGQRLEDEVKSIIEQYNVKLVPYRSWISDPHSFGTRLLITNYPYPTIYSLDGTNNGRMEFFLCLWDDARFVRIECRFQEVAGSVDEKLPYLWANCVDRDYDVIILLEGNGFKAGVRPWLQKQIRAYNGPNNISLFNLDDLREWAALVL